MQKDVQLLWQARTFCVRLQDCEQVHLEGEVYEIGKEDSVDE